LELIRSDFPRTIYEKRRKSFIMIESTKGDIAIRPMERKDIFPALTMLKKIGDARGTLSHRDMVNWDIGGALDLSFIAEKGEQVIGLLLGRFTFHGVPVVQTGVLEILIVDLDYQRQGIAASLVNAALDRCYTEGLNTVLTYIHEKDWEASNLLENLDFKSTGQMLYSRIIEP